MSTLNRLALRNLILSEIERMEEETLLRRHKDPGREMYTRSKMLKCGDCGYKMSEETHEGDTCQECGGAMYEIEETLNEKSCGTSDNYDYDDYEIIDHDMDNNFIPDHMDDLNYHHSDHGHVHVADISILDPDSAFGIGFDAGTSDKFNDEVEIGNHKHHKGAYMAKKQMYKVAKYAEKLYHMIPDGHNLEDWMRTKLAQIADDIGEVYHALDHDVYEGDI